MDSAPMPALPRLSETSRVLHPGAFAMTCKQLQAGSHACGRGLRRHFHP